MSNAKKKKFSGKWVIDALKEARMFSSLLAIILKEKDWINMVENISWQLVSLITFFPFSTERVKISKL